MGIKIITEKRHHVGEEDIQYPAVFCDHCTERIVDATSAGYHWIRPDPADAYTDRATPRFLHHRCNPGPTRLGWSWMPLDEFPLYLGRNLDMDI